MQLENQSMIGHNDTVVAQGNKSNACFVLKNILRMSYEITNFDPV